MSLLLVYDFQRYFIIFLNDHSEIVETFMDFLSFEIWDSNIQVFYNYMNINLSNENVQNSCPQNARYCTELKDLHVIFWSLKPVEQG